MKYFAASILLCVLIWACGTPLPIAKDKGGNFWGGVDDLGTESLSNLDLANLYLTNAPVLDGSGVTNMQKGGSAASNSIYSVATQVPATIHSGTTATNFTATDGGQSGGSGTGYALQVYGAIQQNTEASPGQAYNQLSLPTTMPYGMDIGFLAGSSTANFTNQNTNFVATEYVTNLYLPGSIIGSATQTNGTLIGTNAGTKWTVNTNGMGWTNSAHKMFYGDDGIHGPSGGFQLSAGTFIDNNGNLSGGLSASAFTVDGSMTIPGLVNTGTFAQGVNFIDGSGNATFGGSGAGTVAVTNGGGAAAVNLQSKSGQAASVNYVKGGTSTALMSFGLGSTLWVVAKSPTQGWIGVDGSGNTTVYSNLTVSGNMQSGNGGVAPTSVSLTGSPFTFNCPSGQNVTLYVSGGALTSGLSLNGTTITGTVSTGLLTVNMAPSDSVVITYTVAPNVYYRAF